MSAVHTTLVKSRHAWTAEDTPWDIDVEDDSLQGLSAEHQASWRLFHYISGGGMRTFASNMIRSRVARRQTRLLWFASALGALWLVFRFV